MRRRLMAIGVATAALGAIAYGGVALASGGGGDGGWASGPAAEEAKAAAIAAVGGGTANAVERDSEGGAIWEVEVAKTNGRVVDVRLDASYKVVVIESDAEDSGPADTDSIEEENGADDSSEADETEGSEAPGDDGPGGHADEPANPNAYHEGDDPA